MALEVGKSEVEHHQVGTAPREQRDPFAAGRRLGDVEALGAQADLEEAPDLALVVDHQDARAQRARVAHPVSSAAGGGGSGSGREIRIVVPTPPSPASAATFPP